MEEVIKLKKLHPQYYYESVTSRLIYKDYKSPHVYTTKFLLETENHSQSKEISRI